VTQRIVRGAWRAKRDPAYRLELGSLGAVVDWGYAPDYTDAMARIVAQDEPGDYVIASGEPHTVRDFVEVAFGAAGVDWRVHVVERAGIVSRDQPQLIGDATKLRERTGWRPTVAFAELVGILLRAAEAKDAAEPAAGAPRHR